ncbi:MAG: response regulator [Chloroflexi bacterium]|nr:response regulator [Chloroflexota bacterium]
MSSASCVLVVDDDQSIREFVNLALGEEGYRVVSAADGVSALDVVRQARPDLILLDMWMPDMNGWEFCHAYLQTPEPHAPIIVLTAGHQADVDSGQLKASAFLAKPFELDSLLSLVERHVHRG